MFRLNTRVLAYIGDAYNSLIRLPTSAVVDLGVVDDDSTVTASFEVKVAFPPKLSLHDKARHIKKIDLFLLCITNNIVLYLLFTTQLLSGLFVS